MEWYRPGAVVLQCGADSLAGDRLGCFNLSHKGHARCVEYVKKFGLPTLVLGGGGYTIRNVARCWAYETALLVDKPLHEDIPFNEYFDYYGPDYKMHVPSTNMENMNSKEYLHKLKTKIIENLRHTQFAPSVQSHDVPRDLFSSDDEHEEEDRLEEFDFSFEGMRSRLVNREFQPEDDELLTVGVKGNDGAIQQAMQASIDEQQLLTRDLTAKFEGMEPVSK